ncbi:MAG: hypothetical protein ABJB11_14555 [Ferruginibacter sp.]
MKTSSIKNTTDACTGHFILYCYRAYIFFFKQTKVFAGADDVLHKHIALPNKQYEVA